MGFVDRCIEKAISNVRETIDNSNTYYGRISKLENEIAELKHEKRHRSIKRARPTKSPSYRINKAMRRGQ